MLEEHPLEHLRWIPWVDYSELPAWIRRADICLGIFGTSDKAARVIPNKVFQVLACGRPLITRISPAIQELEAATQTEIYFVPPGDAFSLAAAVLRAAAPEAKREEGPLYSRVTEWFGPRAVGFSALAHLNRLLKRPPSGT